MSPPNAKICPRCGKVVPIQFGVCDHCARLFRTPIEGKPAENRTILFDHLSFPPTPPPLPRLSRRDRLRRLGTRLYRAALQRLTEYGLIRPRRRSGVGADRPKP